MDSLVEKRFIIKACKTKYGEWVVISRDREENGFICIWLSVFKLGKLTNKMPMFLKVNENLSTVKILDIKVLGSDRSRGYGSIFMDELFELVSKRGIKKITGLAERPDDPIMINFYRKYGIEIVGSQLYWEK